MQAFHHPFFADSRSPVHTSMEQVIVNWFGELAEDEQAETLQRLTKVSTIVSNEAEIKLIPWVFAGKREAWKK
jgi:hypothetical protein